MVEKQQSQQQQIQENNLDQSFEILTSDKQEIKQKQQDMLLSLMKKYEKQFSQLLDLGFLDQPKRLLQLLEKHSGSFDEVLNHLRSEEQQELLMVKINDLVIDILQKKISNNPQKVIKAALKFQGDEAKTIEFLNVQAAHEDVKVQLQNKKEKVKEMILKGELCSQRIVKILLKEEKVNQKQKEKEEKIQQKLNLQQEKLILKEKVQEQKKLKQLQKEQKKLKQNMNLELKAGVQESGQQQEVPVSYDEFKQIQQIEKKTQEKQVEKKANKYTGKSEIIIDADLLIKVCSKFKPELMKEENEFWDLIKQFVKKQGLKTIRVLYKDHQEQNIGNIDGVDILQGFCENKQKCILTIFEKNKENALILTNEQELLEKIGEERIVRPRNFLNQLEKLKTKIN